MISAIRIPQLAFTLVELLVVITIIAFLLALLTPALDKAIYQAELTVCAANQHGLGVGVNNYAMDYKRSYPYRQHIHETRAWPSTLSYGLPQWDGRPALKPYISINATLNCPLLPKIDLEGSHSDTAIFSPHNLWFGWQYRFIENGQRFRGMNRIGDRWEWPYMGAGYPPMKSSLLGGTHYAVHVTERLTEASHPSDLRYVVRLQDEAATLDLGSGVSVSIGKFTRATWDSYDYSHGPIDLTNLYADLSVLTTSKVKWELDRLDSDDERVTRVPAYSDGVNWTADGPVNSLEIIPRE